MNIKKHLSFLLIMVIFLSGCSVTDKNSTIEPLSRTEFLMDTVVKITIYDKKDDKILNEVFSRLKQIEERMSATISTSDVNKINENAGIKPIEVNGDTFFVIKNAKKYAELSEGTYDPTIGALVELWDIESGKKTKNSIPTKKEIEEIKSLVDYKKLDILDANKIFLQEKGMKINLGGIVKGYAADEVKNILTKNGVNKAIIDLGGNLYIIGEKEEDMPWKIGIQDPFNYIGSYIGIVDVSDKSIVSSGDYERYFEYKERKYHHILDTKTGYPSENEIAGVSIISDKSIDGDALSTTLFILGVEEGSKFINSIDSVEAIFITKDNNIYIPTNLKDKFKLRQGEADFKIIEY